MVDAFAGPGTFRNPETGEVEIGSPIMMCDASSLASGRCQMFFGNTNRAHHQKLENELRERGVPTYLAQAVHMGSVDLLRELEKVITNHSLLLYCDPFGYKGCEFANFRPFMERSPVFSTEIILNLDVADLHRLAGRKAVSEGRITPALLANHDILTAVLNGEWWKHILLDPEDPKALRLMPEEMERQVVQGYLEQYAPYFKYRGCCPVPESAGGSIKYYITFFSNHPDALIAHNDNMCRAYYDFLAKSQLSGPLFAQMLETVSWQNVIPRDHHILDQLILSQVRQLNTNGLKPSRIDLWLKILTTPGCFMRWTQAEYHERVKILCRVDNSPLKFVDVRGTGRLNDDVQLYVPGIEIPRLGDPRIKRQGTG
jgi:three-Cys-motif partner protein